MHKDFRSVRLSIRIQPRSSRVGFQGFFSTDRQEIKWGVKSPPVDGEANEELCQALAKYFGLPKQNVTLVSGFRSRKKVVELVGIGQEGVDTALQNAK